MEPITNNRPQLRNDDGEIITQQEIAQHHDYIHVATSDNTRKAYQADIRQKFVTEPYF